MPGAGVPSLVTVIFTVLSVGSKEGLGMGVGELGIEDPLLHATTTSARHRLANRIETRLSMAGSVRRDLASLRFA